MGKLFQGCAVAALVGTMGGQAFAQSQSSQSEFIRPVPVMAAPALNTNDEFTGPPDAPLPPGMRDGTLDAQYVRIQAYHAAQLGTPDAFAHQQDASDVVDAGPMPANTAPNPAFDLAPRLLDAASAFDDYMTAAAQVRANFADGGQVAKVVDIASGYEPRQLEAGAIAYAALVALHDPFFVANVRAMNADPRALSEQLISAPQSIMGLSGADRTAATVAAVLRARGGDVFGAGKAVKQSAYDVQHQAWSRGFVADPQAVLARVKASSTQQASPADGARVQRLLQT
ncbi:MAG TPA: hypothetical protein VF459_18265, partial [Caulobacteraceae bacterium]